MKTQPPFSNFSFFLKVFLASQIVLRQYENDKGII